jgi:hypothetical protein
LVVLLSVPNDVEAAAITTALEDQGISAKTTGAGTCSFRAGAPGDVKIWVREEDASRAKDLLETRQTEFAAVDWENVEFEVSEPDDVVRTNVSNEHRANIRVPVVTAICGYLIVAVMALLPLLRSEVVEVSSFYLCLIAISSSLVAACAGYLIAQVGGMTRDAVAAAIFGGLTFVAAMYAFSVVLPGLCAVLLLNEERAFMLLAALGCAGGICGVLAGIPFSPVPPARVSGGSRQDGNVRRSIFVLLTVLFAFASVSLGRMPRIVGCISYRHSTRVDDHRYNGEDIAFALQASLQEVVSPDLWALPIDRKAEVTHPGSYAESEEWEHQDVLLLSNDLKTLKWAERWLVSCQSMGSALQFRILANIRDHRHLIEDARKSESEFVYMLDAQGEPVRDETGAPTLLGWWVPVREDFDRSPESRFPYPEIAKRQRQVGDHAVTEILAVKDQYDVTGSYVTHAAPALDQQGRPKVEFTLDSQGTHLFRGLTDDNLPDDVHNFYRKLALILDGKLICAYPIRGRSDGSGPIVDQAKRFALPQVANGNIWLRANTDGSLGESGSGRNFGLRRTGRHAWRVDEPAGVGEQGIQVFAMMSNSGGRPLELDGGRNRPLTITSPTVEVIHLRREPIVLWNGALSHRQFIEQAKRSDVSYGFSQDSGVFPISDEVASRMQRVAEERSGWRVPPACLPDEVRHVHRKENDVEPLHSADCARFEITGDFTQRQVRDLCDAFPITTLTELHRFKESDPPLLDFVARSARGSELHKAWAEDLASVRKLDLSNIPVTDADLVRLARLTKLQELDLSGTQVTESGVTKLIEVLPDCIVRHDPH